MFVFLFGYKPKDQIKTLSDIKIWTCDSLYLLFLRKVEFPFPAPFTKIVDATELQIITRGS